MPGMTSGVGTGNMLVAEAFRAALRHQLFIVVAIFLLLGLARLLAAGWRPVRGQTATGQPAGGGRAGGDERAGDDGRAGGDTRTAGEPEPPGRRLLRIGFGILWIFDGILQAQPAMPLGLPG